MGRFSVCVSLGAASALAVGVFVGALRAKFPRQFVTDACGNSISPSATTHGVSEFKCGWQELRHGIHVFLQPNGSWCWSNAGLIGESGLLVDTLTDAVLTRGMIESAPGKISRVAYTHPDVDHVMGDQEVPPDVPRYGRVEVQSEMRSLPQMKAGLVNSISLAHYIWQLAEFIGWSWLANSPLWPLGRKVLGWALIQSRMAGFSFHEFDKSVGITEPISTPTAELPGAEFHHLGSIHSKSDSVILVHRSKVCFAGDLLFIGIAPVMWAGPAKSWVTALDRVLEMTGEDWLFVPGHGPVTDVRGVRFMQRYFQYVDSAVASCPTEQSDGDCAESVLEGLPADLMTEEAQRILISVQVERIARRTGKPAVIDLPTKVRFLAGQGERLLQQRVQTSLLG